MNWKILILALVGSFTAVAGQISNLCKLGRPILPIQFTHFSELQRSVIDVKVLKSNVSRGIDAQFVAINFTHISKANFTFDNVTSGNDTSVVRVWSIVETLQLINKRIETIGDNTFSQFECLGGLNISYNLLKNITNKTFAGLHRLEALNLTTNRLENIAVGAFSELTLLQYLDLSYNAIPFLHKNYFNQTVKLKYLNLSRNNIKRMGPFFSTLGQLRELDLGYCGIAIFNTSWVKNCKILEKLDLSGNEMITLYQYRHSFNKASMQLWNLSNNCLMGDKIFVKSLIREFAFSETLIDLNTNQFTCSEWLNDFQIFKRHNITLAPPRKNMTSKKIKGWTCPNYSLHTFNYDPVIIVFVIIFFIFIVLIVIDHRAHLGYRQRITDKVRRYFSSKSLHRAESLSYVHLQPDT